MRKRNYYFIRYATYNLLTILRLIPIVIIRLCVNVATARHFINMARTVFYIFYTTHTKQCWVQPFQSFPHRRNYNGAIMKITTSDSM